MSFDTIQSDAKAALANSPLFAGLEVMLELDPAATPEEWQAADGVFEKAILRQGIVVIIKTPRAQRLDQVKGAGLSLRLLSAVCICEAPNINRAAFNSEHPETVPANRVVARMIEQAIEYLLGAGFEFPDQPIGQPDPDVDGLDLHYLVFGKPRKLLAKT
ncbi:hypothetical protein [Oleiharenicola lentus]|uniref:hypothetical protein n=1 Tax=Oleiharenicola lentus TaxID=2508720 RepID=UPI003F67680B